MRPYGVKKFHTDVFFPRSLRMLCAAWLREHSATYRLSTHAREQLQARNLRLPPALPRDARIIEATTEYESLQKFLIRFAYDDREDLVVGLSISGVVTTVFWNSKDDHHHGLRREEYATAA